MLKELMPKLKAVAELAQETRDEEIIKISKFLKDRIKHPDSFVAMLGETSSGKTTLLNGLLGENCLYTSAKPSTGTVLELEFTPEEVKHQYYAINKNATAEKLSKENFIEYSKNPNDNIKRLWMQIQSGEYGNSRMRLFDTPGYGSIMEKHEDILVEFIPETNIIIYTVAYKTGIQKYEFNFLYYLNEILQDDTELVLVINRVPEQTFEQNGKEDRRINEIKQYISDLLHYTPKTFLVPDIYCDDDEYPLPSCNELWSFIKQNIDSLEHQNHLYKSFEGYIFGLFEKCENFINQKIIAHKLDQNGKDILIKEYKDIISQLENAKIEFIKPVFTEIMERIPSSLARAEKTVYEIIEKKIDDSSKAKKDEVQSFVNVHMLQFETKKQIKELSYYIEAKLKRLGEQIDNLLNKCVQQADAKIKLNLSPEMANLAKGLFMRHAGKFLETAVLNYFKKFAGSGGTGIANGAKHLLKKFGDSIGKTFSRQTHNQLAKTLSKIGATSAKAVGMAFAVILEAGWMAGDALTWQLFLKKNVKKAMKKWHDEVLESYIEDIKKCEEANLNLLDEEIAVYKDIIENLREKNIDEKRVLELTKLLNNVKIKLGEYSYE